MLRRQSIVKEVAKALQENKLPMSVESGNVKQEQNLFRRMFQRRNLNIGVSTEPDRGLLWFRKRKK